MTDETKIYRKNLNVLPLYFEKTIPQWLGVSTNESTPPTFSSKGPSKFNKHDSLLRDGSDCFTIHHPPASARKKKILISYPLDDKPELGEICILSELIENYQVYLWNGARERLAQAVPLKDLRDFANKKETIEIDTKAHIKSSLANQQIALDDWIILDRQAWEERWDIPKNKITYPR